MSKLKKALLMALSLVLVAAMSIGGTVAYLQDDDSDVNVMTLGNVDIVQHEYQRVVKADGSYETDTIDGQTSYVLEDFDQKKEKSLYPAVIPNGGTVNGVTWDYDAIPVRMSQVKSYGGASVFNTPNAMDKFVTVENTGKSDAYVRTLIAFEMGDLTVEEFSEAIGSEIRANENGDGKQPWKYGFAGAVEIHDNNYYVYEFIYCGAQTSTIYRHENGVLPAGDTSYPSLCQVYMTAESTNETVEKIDGDKDGKYNILVLSQAVQTAGFDTAKTALDTAFGEANATNAAEWFEGVLVPRVKTVAELREALATGGEFALANDIVVEASELLYAADGGHSDGSAFFVKNDTVIDLNGHDIKVTSGNAWSDVFFMKFGADLTIKGEGDIEADCSIACVYDANSTLNVEGGNFYVTANNDMLYAIYGKINVSGGTFTTSYWNTINIYGSGRVDRVDVSGGSFENWSPASSPDGNLLADGYKVVSKVVDGVTWYEVVAE